MVWPWSLPIALYVPPFYPRALAPSPFFWLIIVVPPSDKNEIVVLSSKPVFISPVPKALFPVPIPEAAAVWNWMRRSPICTTVTTMNLQWVITFPPSPKPKEQFVPRLPPLGFPRLKFPGWPPLPLPTSVKKI